MRIKTFGSGLVTILLAATGCNSKGGSQGTAVTTATNTSASSSTTQGGTDTANSDSASETTSSTSNTSTDPSTSSTTTTSSSSTTTSGSTTGGRTCTPEIDPPPPCRRPAPPAPPHLNAPGVDWFMSPNGPAGRGSATVSNAPDPVGATTGTTGVFIWQPDAGSSLECDIWAQDCPNGEKCMPWANDGGSSWNALKCSPIDPNPKAPGEACTVQGNGVSGVDDCELGAMCWDVDPQTNQGTCVAMCTCSEANPICESTATTCTISNDGVLILCLPLCDPLDAPCDDGDVCIPNSQGEGFICVLDASGDGGQAGDSCEYINGCDPGLICAQAASVEGCAGSVGCCAPLCDLDAAGTCPGPNESCVPFYEAGSAPACLDDLGLCTLP